MGNILFAVLFTDKYSITEIRLQYWELRHTKKSICNLFCFPWVFRPLSYSTLHLDSVLPWNNASSHSAHCTKIIVCVIISACRKAVRQGAENRLNHFTLQSCFQISWNMHFDLDRRKVILKGNDKSDNAYLRKQGNTQYSNGCSTICTKYYS